MAVVDRAGTLQLLLRDRFAGANTVDIATNKAWTAASFKISSAALAQETQAGKPMSGIRAHPRVIAAGGGQVIEGGASLLGAICVLGAPVATSTTPARWPAPAPLSAFDKRAGGGRAHQHGISFA